MRRRTRASDDVVGARDLLRPRLYVAEACPSGLQVIGEAAPAR
jgi:hypothetical protein